MIWGIVVTDVLKIRITLNFPAQPRFPPGFPSSHLDLRPRAGSSPAEPEFLAGMKLTALSIQHNPLVQLFSKHHQLQYAEKDHGGGEGRKLQISPVNCANPTLGHRIDITCLDTLKNCLKI